MERGADLIITYAGDMAGEANREVSAPSYPGYAGPPPSVDSTMWTGTSGSSMTMIYPKGALVVELMEARTAKILWRGLGSVELDMEKKTESVRRINDAIVKMFVQYPPKKK